MRSFNEDGLFVIVKEQYFFNMACHFFQPATLHLTKASKKLQNFNIFYTNNNKMAANQTIFNGQIS